MKLEEFKNGKYAIEKYLNFKDGSLMKCITYNIKKVHGELIISFENKHMFALATENEQELLLKHLIPIADIINHDEIENIVNELPGTDIDDHKFRTIYQLLDLACANDNDLDVQSDIMSCVNHVSNSIKKENKKITKEILNKDNDSLKAMQKALKLHKQWMKYQQGRLDEGKKEREHVGGVEHHKEWIEIYKKVIKELEL